MPVLGRTAGGDVDHADEDDTSPVLGRSGLVNDAGATQNEVGTDGVH